MAKPRVYIETTIPSYLTAWPSNDVIRIAHQRITQDWWAKRDEFELYVSRLVLQECGRGDPQAAAQRLSLLVALPSLTEGDAVVALSKALMREARMPTKAAVDALHVAVSAVNGIDYLLTWNCKHLANVVLRPRIENVCRKAGFEPPIVCTPLELLGEYSGDD